MFGQPVGKTWYFESTAHTEALNRLVYVAEQGEPFVLLMAEHGAGKTTVLGQVREHCRGLGYSAMLVNVAALDELSFLWHICGGLSITPHTNQGRSELMTAIRDELSGRALCSHRTVIILDDLHSAGADLSLMIQFLSAINQQTDGEVCVIAAAEQSLPAEIHNLSALKVRLALLDDTESRDFIIGMLASANIASDRISEDGMASLVSLGGGNPSQLTRICEVVQVAAVTNETMVINSEVLDALAAETLNAQTLSGKL